MNCKYTVHIDENLRLQLANNMLTGDTYESARDCDLRGMAVLELGYLDVEVNIGVDEDRHTPHADLFCCADTAYSDPSDRFTWEELGYLDEYLPGEQAEVCIDWFSPDWKELLFQSMLMGLLRYAEERHLSFTKPYEDAHEGETCLDHDGRQHWMLFGNLVDTTAIAQAVVRAAGENT